MVPNRILRALSFAAASGLLLGLAPGCQTSGSHTAGRASLGLPHAAARGDSAPKRIAAAPSARGPADSVHRSAGADRPSGAEWTAAGRETLDTSDGELVPRLATDDLPLRSFRDDPSPTATAYVRRGPQPIDRASSASATLQFNSGAMAEMPLAIGRLAFCSEVRDYDQFVETPLHEITPGQTLLLYASLHNFRSQGRRGGYETRTRSTIEIRNRAGVVVHRLAPAEATDVSREPRHGYFLTHELSLPRELPAGSYTVRLQIDDLLSGQTCDAELPFCIQGGS